MNAIYPAAELTNIPNVGKDVEFMPLLTNITSGDDFSQRYFYKGKCLSDPCD